MMRTHEILFKPYEHYITIRNKKFPSKIPIEKHWRIGEYSPIPKRG